MVLHVFCVRTTENLLRHAYINTVPNLIACASVYFNCEYNKTKEDEASSSLD